MSSNDVVACMSERINRGKFREAIEIAEANETNPDYQSRANFYFQWALAKQLTGQDPSEQYDRMRQCPEFTDQMEGDMLRDDALTALRYGYLQHADQTLDQVERLHEYDQNRLAVAKASRARLQFERGSYGAAFDLHQEAARMWRDISDPDKQWIKNNNYHWLKTVAALGERDLHLFLEVVLHDRRRDRRAAAFLMFILGRRGLERIRAYEKSKF